MYPCGALYFKYTNIWGEGDWVVAKQNTRNYPNYFTINLNLILLIQSTDLN